MRCLFVSAVAAGMLLAGAAQATTNSDWSPQIPSLRLTPPLVPDPSSAGYAYGAGGASGIGYQLGSNPAAASGVLYAIFQKGGFPFRLQR